MADVTNEDREALRQLEECQRLAQTSPAGAIVKATSYLNSQVSKAWTDKNAEIFRIIVDNSIALRTPDNLKNGLQSLFRMLNQKHKLHIFAQEAFYILNSISKKLLATDGANAATSADDEDDAILAALTGIPRAELTAKRRTKVAMDTYMTSLRHILSVIYNSPKSEVHFHRFLQHGFALTKEQDRKHEFVGLCKMLEDHTRRFWGNQQFYDNGNVERRNRILSQIDEVRREVQSNDELQHVMLETRNLQLEAALALSSWRSILPIVEDFSRWTNNFRKWGKQVKNETMRRHWQLLSKAFFVTGNMTFHALCQHRFARTFRAATDNAAEIEIAASQNILAVLSMPEVVEKTIQTAERDTDRQKELTLCKSLNLTVTPTREWLLKQLYRPTPELNGRSLFDVANADVRAIHAKIAEVSSVLVCREAAPLLNRIAAIPALQPYVASIQVYAVRALLQVVSKCFSRVSIDHLCQLCAFYSRAQFSSTLEPLLLEASAEESGNGATVAIDYGTASVTFAESSTNPERIASIQTILAAELSAASTECYRAAVKPPVITGALQAIEAERERILARNAICTLRLANASDRLQQLKDEEEKRKEEAQKKKQEAEQKRVERANAALRKRLAKQAGEEEALERRKWTIAALMQKYKAFKVTNQEELLRMSADKFTNKLSELLCAHRREIEMKRSNDVRLMDHFERSSREVEAPIRKEKEAEMVESVRAEQQKRRENAIRKHRDDYEKAVEVKSRLEKLKGAKTQYEKELSESLKSKLDATNRKRVEEQDELDRMMREREERARAAGGSSGAAAAAASAPERPAPPPASVAETVSPQSPASPPPTPVSTGDTLSSGGPGKWVPKSRKV